MFKEIRILSFAVLGLANVTICHADVVTEWNLRTAQFTFDARYGLPEANQVIATAGVSVSDALTAIAGKATPLLVKLGPMPGASIEATVASASYHVLLKMVPGQQSGIEAAFQIALAKIPDGVSKEDGIALGKQAVEAVLLGRAVNGGGALETYRRDRLKIGGMGASRLLLTSAM